MLEESVVSRGSRGSKGDFKGDFRSSRSKISTVGRRRDWRGVGEDRAAGGRARTREEA